MVKNLSHRFLALLDNATSNGITHGMRYTIPMDKAGRIVIPKEVRERIGADETTRFDLEVVLDRIELTRKEAREQPRVFKEGRMWVASTGGKPFNAEESIRALRDERLELTTLDTGKLP